MHLRGLGRWPHAQRHLELLGDGNRHVRRRHGARPRAMQPPPIPIKRRSMRGSAGLREAGQARLGTCRPCAALLRGPLCGRSTHHPWTDAHIFTPLGRWLRAVRCTRRGSRRMVCSTTTSSGTDIIFPIALPVIFD